MINGSIWNVTFSFNFLFIMFICGRVSSKCIELFRDEFCSVDLGIFFYYCSLYFVMFFLPPIFDR